MNRRLKFLFLSVVVLMSLRYWISAAWHHPGEPLSVLALTKSGDIEYYPMIAALARGELGEAIVYEHAGSGIVSFPVLSLAPHAIAVAIFGTPGFIVADVLVYLAIYIALVWLFAKARIASPWRECISLFLVSGGAEIQYLALSTFAPSLWRWMNAYDLTFWMWGDRVPRPFVSELYLIVALGAMISLLHSARSLVSAPKWALLGVSLAALLQGDLHGTIELSMMAACVAAYALWRVARRRARVVRALTVCVVTALLCSGLFIIQRLFEHPDVAARLGIFPIHRFDRKFVDIYAFRRLAPIPLILGVSAAAVARLGRRIDRPFKLRTLGFLLIGNVLACFALPISVLVLGKGVQIYHFNDRFMHVRTYTAIIAAAWLASAVAYRLRARATASIAPGAQRRRQFAIAGVLVWAFGWFGAGLTASSGSIDRWVVGSGFRVVHRDERLHMRAATFPEWASLTDYRPDFAELARELSRPRYAAASVIGTFDLQVYSWWMTFHHGYSFLPQAFLTTRPDAEIEDRLMRLCHVLGLNDEAFKAFIDRRYVTVFWLGLDKYQASQAFVFRPLDDYPPSVRQELAWTTIYSNWNIELPTSEEQRLVQAYDSLRPESTPRLDVIVLLKRIEPFQPAPQDFQLAFENRTFRVWVRNNEPVALSRDRR